MLIIKKVVEEKEVTEAVTCDFCGEKCKFNYETNSYDHARLISEEEVSDNSGQIICWRESHLCYSCYYKIIALLKHKPTVLITKK